MGGNIGSFHSSLARAGHKTLISRASVRAPRAGAIKLRSQLNDSPSTQATAQLSEEMMLLLALQQQNKAAVPTGTKVVVFGALDRLGQLLVRHMAKDGRYTPVIQTMKDYEQKVLYRTDGVEEIFPPEAEVYFEEIPANVSAAVLSVEKPTDPETMKNVLALGIPFKRFILLSKIGVDERENDWKLKLNPFLQLDKWAALEQTLKECAEIYNFDYTILRVGNLKGGPFYDTNKDFEQALNDRIFDAEEARGISLKLKDQSSADSGRDVVAQCLVQCLTRADTANKVLSLVSCKTFREDGVGCSENNFLQLPPAMKNRERKVFTPSRQEWNEAFKKALE
eukprot:749300-Hanusia_phi.AAC.7